MNIFILDSDPVLNAQYHVDKHVVKIITEINQMLCSTHHVLQTGKNIPYRLSYANHPCTKWMRESMDNYNWSVELCLKLCFEYSYRYNKVHAGEKVALWCKENIPEINKKGLTPFYLAMPDEYKCECPIQSYRNYYNGAKTHLFSWTKREKPHWIGDIK